MVLLTPLHHAWQMLYAYLDESYTDDFYFIAAAIGSEAQWVAVDDRLRAIREVTSEQHQTALDVEFHAYDLMSGKRDWKKLRGKHREAAGIYRAVLLAAKEEGIRCLLRGVDVERLNARYRYPKQPHEVVLGHLLERIDENSRQRHRSTDVTVIADEIATKDQHIAQFGAYQKLGTPGYRPSLLKTIVPPIQFADSKSASGLQVADFAAYLHRRRQTVAEINPDGRKAVARLCKELDAMTQHQLTWWP